MKMTINFDPIYWAEWGLGAAVILYVIMALYLTLTNAGLEAVALAAIVSCVIYALAGISIVTLVCSAIYLHATN